MVHVLVLQISNSFDSYQIQHRIEKRFIQGQMNRLAVGSVWQSMYLLGLTVPNWTGLLWGLPVTHTHCSQIDPFLIMTEKTEKASLPIDINGPNWLHKDQCNLQWKSLPSLMQMTWLGMMAEETDDSSLPINRNVKMSIPHPPKKNMKGATEYFHTRRCTTKP